MYICVGDLDDMHSPDNMEKFKNDVAALGNENIVFHRFEGVGHETPRAGSAMCKKSSFQKCAPESGNYKNNSLGCFTSNPRRIRGGDQLLFDLILFKRHRSFKRP